MKNRKIIKLYDRLGTSIETSEKEQSHPYSKFYQSKLFFIGSVLYLTAMIASHSDGLKNFHNNIFPKTEKQAIQKIEKSKKIIPKEKPKPKTQKTLESKLETVPTFKGYELDNLKIYDNIIIQARNFWNEYLKDEENYIQPLLSDLKKQMLVETAYGGMPVEEFYTDPMQTRKDFADKITMEEGGEGFYPLGGVKELKNLNLSQAQRSIYTGVGWFIHKSAKYSYNKKQDKRFIKSIDYNKGHKKYNGGGDEKYQEKIDSLKPKIRKDMLQTKQNNYRKASNQ